MYVRILSIYFMPDSGMFIKISQSQHWRFIINFQTEQEIL